MAGDARKENRVTAAPVDPAEFRMLAEQVEQAGNEIEALVNRMNTLVHLLDILNKRVDRLESQS